MNVQLDLILPPIVVGILLLLVLSLNTRMMESQVDNRLQADMQTFANSAMDAMQERFRDIEEITAISDSTLSFRSITGDSVSVRRAGRNLLLLTYPAGLSPADTQEVAARISRVQFTTLFGANTPPRLRVRVESRSLAAEEVADSPTRQLGFAERDFYLRNLAF